MKAVIYSRVSTDIQSTERQITELRELATLKNYTIVEVYEDVITGASKAADRAGFEKMLKFLTINQDVKMILCWELSRFGRSMIDVYQNINNLRDIDINVYFKKEGIETLSSSPTSQLQLNLLASFAEFERSTIKERTISGRRNSVKKGGAGGGVIKAYGYSIDLNKKLIVNSNEAKVIIQIFDWYINHGLNSHHIALKLNNDKVPTKYQLLKDENKIKTNLGNGGWRNILISKILRNRLYTGHRVYGNIEYFDEKLQIIDDDLFIRVQNKLDNQRNFNPNAQKFQQIFKSKLFCGICGSGFIMRKGRTKNSYNHYLCFSHVNEAVNVSKCSNKMIKIDILNNVLYHLLNRYQISNEAIKERIEQNNIEIRKRGVILDSLNGELTKVATKKSKLLDLYLNNAIDKELYTTRLKEIEEGAIQYESEITENLNEVNELVRINKELESKEVINLQSPELFKKHINSLVERITIREVEDYSKFNFKPTTKHYLLSVKVQMIDVNAVFEAVISNKEQVPIVITI